MFWGIKDSSSYFCEKPYSHNNYIAEYYNTLSAIPYLLVGIYIYAVLNYKNIGRSVVCIGLGTIMLHGTQRYYGQWADEMSMIYFCFTIIQRLNKRIHNSMLGLIYMFYYIVCDYWFFFIIIFYGLMRYLFYLLKHKKKKKNKFFKITKNILLLSSFLWLFDQISCDTIGNFYLHAIWHIGTAFAIFYGVLHL